MYYIYIKNNLYILRNKLYIINTQWINCALQVSPIFRLLVIHNLSPGRNLLHNDGILMNSE